MDSLTITYILWLNPYRVLKIRTRTKLHRVLILGIPKNGIPRIVTLIITVLKLTVFIIISQTDGQPFKELLDLIRENVSYEDLQTAYEGDIELVDEFIAVILDALVSEGKTVRINGENKPRELVKSNLMKLTYPDIEHVLRQFKEHGERIQKKTQYILSMLYHSPMERNAHYTNWVQADMFKKGETDGADR